jgi:hypothetical protein
MRVAHCSEPDPFVHALSYRRRAEHAYAHAVVACIDQRCAVDRRTDPAPTRIRRRAHEVQPTTPLAKNVVAHATAEPSIRPRKCRHVSSSRSAGTSRTPTPLREGPRRTRRRAPTRTHRARRHCGDARSPDPRACRPTARVELCRHPRFRPALKPAREQPRAQVVRTHRRPHVPRPGHAVRPHQSLWRGAETQPPADLHVVDQTSATEASTREERNPPLSGDFPPA